MALGPTQTMVLCVLDEVAENEEAAPTAVEIGEQIAAQMVEFGLRSPDCRIPETNAALGALRRMERRGLVERLGTASTGGRCWGITGLGQDALKQIDNTKFSSAGEEHEPLNSSLAAEPPRAPGGGRPLPGAGSPGPLPSTPHPSGSGPA